MDDFETTALGLWLKMHPARAVEVRRVTACELDRLLGSKLGMEAGSPVDVRSFVSEAGYRVDALEGPIRALVECLAPDAARPGASLVEALAEILFLPRHSRGEYLSNRLASKPWDIRRLLLEYAVWARRFHETATSLTGQFCATRCDRLPWGCCSIPGYDMGLVPEAMLQAQQLEADLVAHVPPSAEDECRYHGKAGCSLVRFKSPACCGMLCGLAVSDLRVRYGREAVESFLRPLALFRNQVLNREEIFEAMRKVVSAARAVRGVRAR